MPGELIPQDWIGRYVSVEIGTTDPVRLTARLDMVLDGGIVALVKVAVPNAAPTGRWSAPSYATRFAPKCYPWHTVFSVRLLEPEEREALEEWPPETS